MFTIACIQPSNLATQDVHSLGGRVVLPIDGGGSRLEILLPELSTA